MGQHVTTDASGQVTFNLPPADYQVRADVLSSQTWSAVFNQTDTTVNIDHGRSTVHVFTSGSDLYDVPVYLFTQAGAYLGRVERTDPAGLAEFHGAGRRLQVKGGLRRQPDLVGCCQHPCR
jgi:hypothetical protein